MEKLDFSDIDNWSIEECMQGLCLSDCTVKDKHPTKRKTMLTRFHIKERHDFLVAQLRNSAGLHVSNNPTAPPVIQICDRNIFDAVKVINACNKLIDLAFGLAPINAPLSVDSSTFAEEFDSLYKRNINLIEMLHQPINRKIEIKLSHEIKSWALKDCLDSLLVPDDVFKTKYQIEEPLAVKIYIVDRIKELNSKLTDSEVSRNNMLIFLDFINTQKTIIEILLKYQPSNPFSLDSATFAAEFVELRESNNRLLKSLIDSLKSQKDAIQLQIDRVEHNSSVFK